MSLRRPRDELDDAAEQKLELLTEKAASTSAG